MAIKIVDKTNTTRILPEVGEVGSKIEEVKASLQSSISSKYTKPSGGIPASDLAFTVSRLFMHNICMRISGDGDSSVKGALSIPLTHLKVTPFVNTDFLTMLENSPTPSTGADRIIAASGLLEYQGGIYNCIGILVPGTLICVSLGNVSVRQLKEPLWKPNTLVNDFVIPLFS